MRVACVRNAYTIERLRNLWTRTGGACAHAQFPVILECPLINTADVENTRTWIYRRDDDGRWLETFQESGGGGEERGGEGEEGKGRGYPSRENVQLSLFRNFSFGLFENKIPIARIGFDRRGYNWCTLFDDHLNWKTCERFKKNLRNTNCF